MQLLLLHEAREQVLWQGYIGPRVSARLDALGYDVPSLETRLRDQLSSRHTDLIKFKECQ